MLRENKSGALASQAASSLFPSCTVRALVSSRPLVRLRPSYVDEIARIHLTSTPLRVAVFGGMSHFRPALVASSPCPTASTRTGAWSANARVQDGITPGQPVPIATSNCPTATTRTQWISDSRSFHVRNGIDTT